MAFHVPESARDRTHPVLKSSITDGNNGAFRLPSPQPGWHLIIVASDGYGWEHASVHASRNSGKHREQWRTPTWQEMVFVKERFWDDEDVVMQLHPRRSTYVNVHPHTLHLWRPKNTSIPVPPMEFV